MKKKLSSGLNVGSSSILVTFVLLCLVTFAALSFLSANSDYRLSRQAADRTTDFYEANQMAEIYMANIEALLAKQYAICEDENRYLKAIPDIFADNDRIIVDISSTPITLQYSIVVNKTQDLQVCLSIHYPDTKDPALFHIQKWQTVANETWQEEAVSPEEETGLMHFK
ncbi:MAG: hypothetical protein QM697_13640 [Lachnospiraceae bacterium]